MVDKVKTVVRIYKFRNRLREKCAGLGVEHAQISEEALALAEAALSEMAEDYPDWVSKEIDKLAEYQRRCIDTPEERRDYFIKIGETAHDMKGQGGTFGYPLITAFADSLYKFADEKGQMSDHDVELIKSHVDAMRAVIRGRVSGDGGEIGEQLKATLEQAIAKKAKR